MTSHDRDLIIALGAALSRAAGISSEFDTQDAWGDNRQLLAVAAATLKKELPEMKREAYYWINSRDEMGLMDAIFTCDKCDKAVTCPHAYDHYNAGDGTDCLASK